MRMPRRNLLYLAILWILVMNFFLSGQGQVHLTMTSNPTFCFGSRVVLVCHYPTVLEKRSDGEYKYLTFLPSWKCNCVKFILDANGTRVVNVNSTAQKLEIPVNMEIFGDSPCSCECYLYLANQTEDKSNQVLLQPLKPKAPLLFVVSYSSNSVDIYWNYSMIIDCYKSCRFTYDVQLYEMNSMDSNISRSLLGHVHHIQFNFLDYNKSYTAKIKTLCVLNDVHIFSEPIEVTFQTKVPWSPNGNLSRFPNNASNPSEVPSNETVVEAKPESFSLNVAFVVVVIAVMLVVITVSVVTIILVSMIIVRKKYTHKIESKSSNLKDMDINLPLNASLRPSAIHSSTEPDTPAVSIDLNPSYLPLELCIPTNNNNTSKS